MARDAPARQWSFARRPFWLFSHVFAATVIVSFVMLGFWQLSRHQERAERNDLIAERSQPPAVSLSDVADQPVAELDYRYVAVGGSFIDGDFVRVANRTHNALVGQHVVALFETDDGQLLLVNRGFVALGDGDVDVSPAVRGPVMLNGWLRESVERAWIGATDTGEGGIVPRLDVEAIASRYDASQSSPVLPVWLQVAPDETAPATSSQSYPSAVPLPPLDGGPHLSYMGQWFIFATLGALFYGALLRRTAAGRQRRAPTPIAP